MGWMLVFWLPLAFLCGSIPFGYLFARARGIDVRRMGSGNIGATNVARTAGRALGIWTLVADLAKGLLPTLAARLSFPYGEWAAWVALAAVLGHVFSPWLRFQGGKGVATAAGGMAVVTPSATAGAVVVFLLVVLRSRYVSLASLCAALALPLLCILLRTSVHAFLAAVILAALIVYRHRDNLQRLLSGTEPKLGRPGQAATPDK